MTAVMRAAAVPAAARVPRIAVVIGGRIVDERIFREAEAITVGTAEDAVFTVASSSLPESFVLFERPGGGTKHYLRFTETMSGRVAIGSERLDVAELRARAHESRGAWRIELPDDARGKIVVGDVAFLFQLVAPPPMAARPRLPLGVLSGPGASIDWRLAIIAAMSFLAHFAIVGGAYSDWMDPVVDADRSVAALVDLKRSLPDVPVDDPALDRPAPTDAPAPTKDQAAHTAKGAPSKTGPATTKRPGSMSDDRAADLAAKADAMQMGMLVSLTGGPATKAAIDRGEIPPVDLTSAAQSAKGIAENPNALDLGHGGQPVKAGPNGGLANLAPGAKGDAKQGSGKETDVGGPAIAVDVRPTTTGGAISDADRVVLGLRSRFRKCYQNGLDKDPTMGGRAVLSAKIAPNGEVASVDVTENAGLSSEVTSCMARAVKNASFTGNGGFTTVRIPVTFVQQK